ncbi:hypothetical protein Lal_00014277 [Lupinus albus]|nr:hypothetical protein Lal_00014277 [Lupinus albus]
MNLAAASRVSSESGSARAPSQLKNPSSFSEETHECNRRYHRPRDSGFARQPHRRMRRAARIGHDGPRGGAVGRVHGSREAIELRDGEAGRYNGKGVLKAVEHINTEISEAIMGLDASEQAFLDKTLLELDGTDNKSRLGANAMLAVSMAVAKAAPKRQACRCTAISAVRAQCSCRPALRRGSVPRTEEDPERPRHEHGSRRRRRLRAELRQQRRVPVDDPAGDREGRLPCGRDVLLALDCAASEFYHDGKYQLAGEGLQLSSAEFTDYLATLADKFPIVSIEDGMHESDWEGWKLLTDRLGKKVQLSATTCSSRTRAS